MLPHRPEIAALGAQLVFVSTGGAHFARAFAEERGVEGPVLIDEDRVAYKALSLQRSFGSTFSVGAVKAGRRAAAAGFRQGRTQGDAWQQGGVFVVMPDGSVPFSHASAFAGDHPDEAAVMAALRDAVAAQPD